jgi:AcrR family transcriptional regulator
MSRGKLKNMKEILTKRESNKIQKISSFLEAAEKLFTEKGFENTSVDEVVKTAGLTKRTLYQYFLSKEDLYYAVALKGAKLLYDASVISMEQGVNTRDKIRLANLAHLAFYLEHLDLFRILNFTPSNLQNCEASPYYREVKMLDAQRMMSFASMVADAKTDGSINSELDMKKAVLFGFLSASSLLYSFSFIDKRALTELSIDSDEFLEFSFALLSDALK